MSEHTKDPLAVELGRRGGLKGAATLYARLTPEERSARARHAARVRWGKPPHPDTELPLGTRRKMAYEWRFYVTTGEPVPQSQRDRGQIYRPTLTLRGPSASKAQTCESCGHSVRGENHWRQGAYSVLCLACGQDSA